MRSGNRRTATRVRDGRVRKKNNWRADRRDYFALPQDEVRLDRRAPGPGFRHVLTVAHVREFIGLLPDWEEIAVGLDAIVLDAGREWMGLHTPGVVEVCAWEQDLWWDDLDPRFEAEHRALLDLLDVERVRLPRGRTQARWTEAQARAFQLLHILPHELGHHHDRMTTASRLDTARGEPYAERYANEVLEAVWPSYARRFGI